MPPFLSTDPAVDEFEKRKAHERDKAIRKYGQDALLPAGRPEFDVLDYMINELVGIVRYAEMNAERFRMMEKLLDHKRGSTTRTACREGTRVALALAKEAEIQAVQFIDLRQELKKAGYHLGLTENTE